MHAFPLNSKISRSASSSVEVQHCPQWDAGCWLEGRHTAVCGVLRECFPCSLAVPKEVRRSAPGCSSACPFLPAGGCSWRGEAAGPWQEVPNPEMGHLGISTKEKKVPKCPCCFLHLGPTDPKGFLAGSGMSCSAIGTMVMVGSFPPSSRGWPTLEEPFPFLASGQRSQQAGSAQEGMLKPFCRDTDGPKLGAWREAARPWLFQCVGQWVKGGALLPAVLCGDTAAKLQQVPGSCASVHTAGTINSTYPRQTGTDTKGIKEMNCFSPSFHILLLIIGTFSLGKCSCKASEQSAAHEEGETTFSCK